MWKFVFVVLFIVVLGYAGYLACVSCAEVKGTSLGDAPCTPILSNGRSNPHYGNMWRSCQDTCARGGKAPALDIKSCECNCR